jgi:hypothetical protein
MSSISSGIIYSNIYYQTSPASSWSQSRISHVLAELRLAEVVRYETGVRQARYRLKHPRPIRQLLRALAEFIDSASPPRR